MKFDDFQTDKSKSVSWGKINDYVAGTLIGKSVNSTPDQYGNTAVIYEFQVEEGFYHERKRDAEGKIDKSSNPDAVKITLEKGETVAVWAKVYGGKKNSVLASQLEKYPMGIYAKVVFTETKPTDKGNDAKIINTLVKKNKDGSYAMNNEWIESKKAQYVQEDAPAEKTGGVEDEF